MDSAAADGGCGQPVDGLALRAARFARTTAHRLTTAALDSSSTLRASDLPTATWTTAPLRSALDHTAHRLDGRWL